MFSANLRNRYCLLIIILSAVISGPLHARGRSDRDKREFDKQRKELNEKFLKLEEQFEILIQDYDIAKMESKDTHAQWKVYSNSWKRKFGRPRDYGLKRKPKFANLKMTNDRLLSVAKDMERLVGAFGRNIEGRRKEKTIQLENSIEKRLNGIRELVQISVPAVRKGKWAEAGDVRWRIASARRQRRNRYKNTRLATVKLKVQITGEFMKRLEADAMMLMSEGGKKIYPILKFDASFAYSKKERPPYGRFLEATRIHSFTVVFEIPDDEREYILKVNDLEDPTDVYSYISLRI